MPSSAMYGLFAVCAAVLIIVLETNAITVEELPPGKHPFVVLFDFFSISFHPYPSPSPFA